MTKEQIARNQKVIAALKKNTKKAQGTMRRFNGGRCCLCVAEDAVIEDGLKIEKCGFNVGLPSVETKIYLGWDNKDPNIRVLPDFDTNAAEINDSKLNIPHKIIAEFFANTFTRKKFKLSPEARVYAERLKRSQD